MSEHYTMPSMVYFLRPVGQDGPVKIGCSSAPANRLETFAAWSPVTLEIAASAPGGYAEEQRLHNAFAAQHSHGEWFHASPDLTLLVERVAAGDDFAVILDGLSFTGSIKKKILRKPWSDGRRAYHRELMRVHWAEKRAEALRGESLWAPDGVNSAINALHREDRVPTAEEQASIDALVADPYAFLCWDDRFPGERAPSWVKKKKRAA